MNFDVEIFEGKKYGDLLKDIVKNHKSKQGQIKALIDNLTGMVNEPGDAVMIVPLIKGYLDSDIKNDEALVKIAQIAAKAAMPQTQEGTSGGLSEKELEQLFADIHTSTLPFTDTEIKKLTN